MSKIYVVVFTSDSVKGCDTVVARFSGGDTQKLYLGSHLQYIYIYKTDRMSKIYIPIALVYCSRKDCQSEKGCDTVVARCSIRLIYVEG
jgi:hypothetical protein